MHCSLCTNTHAGPDSLHGGPAFLHPTGTRRLSLSLLALLLIALTGCVPATNSSSGETLESEINIIKHDSIVSKKDISLVKEELAEVKKTMQSMASAPAPTVPRDEAFDALRESQSELYLQVTALQEEMQRVIAEMEEGSHRNKSTIAQATSEIDLIKGRLDESPGGAHMEALVKRVDSLARRLDAIEAKLSPSIPVPLPGGANTVSPAPPSGATAEALYKEAYALFEQSQYSQSRAQMQTIIERFPKHDLAGNAYFWIGESYYNQQRYDDAILAYQDLLDKFPGHRKESAALLKQGYAFLNIGDKVAARGILRVLIDKYPNDDVTKLALKKLKDMDE